MSDHQSNSRPLLIAVLCTACLLIFGAVFLAYLDETAPRRGRDSEIVDPLPSRSSETISSGSEPRLAPVPVVVEEIGNSVLGRPIERVVIGGGQLNILLLASIHGNEAAGTPLLNKLVRKLKESPELLDGRRVIVLPMVNPDGVAANQRLNARGIDLNRNFPAENRKNTKLYGLEALSEPEAVAIFRTIESFLPSHIVTLHQPLNCVDFDGPARDLAATMSAVCPLPVKKLGSRPGSLGSYGGVTLGIPTITFELPRNARDLNDDQLWALYGNALLTAVEWSPPAEEVTPPPESP